MRKLSLLALVLATAACRDSGGGDDTGGTDSNTGGEDVKIQDIQDPAMTNGTAVAIKGVVVTAIDSFGGKTGDIWVQADLPAEAVSAEQLDRLLGLVVEGALNARAYASRL